MKTAEQLAQRAKDLRTIADKYHTGGRARMNEISPDHIRIAQEVMWGGVWSQPGLDLKLRSVAAITAQCVNGRDFGIHHQVRVGLALGLTPQKVKAILAELVFYVGMPASIFALSRCQEVIDEREEWKTLDTPLDEPWLSALTDKTKRGRELRCEAWGEKADRELAASITHEFLPETAQVVDGYLYGEMWMRSPLEPKERMVMVLAALLCRNHMRQLKRQVGYALDAGLSKHEICEVFSQAGWYRGWPLVEDALIEAKDVFAERGV